MGVDSQDLQTLKDPVCGMKVTEKSPNVFNYKNKPIYFCSAGCKTKFISDPTMYSAADAKPISLEVNSTSSVQAMAGTIYTCPMHPERHFSGIYLQCHRHGCTWCFSVIIHFNGTCICLL